MSKGILCTYVKIEGGIQKGVILKSEQEPMLIRLNKVRVNLLNDLWAPVLDNGKPKIVTKSVSTLTKVGFQD